MNIYAGSRMKNSFLVRGLYEENIRDKSSFKTV